MPKRPAKVKTDFSDCPVSSRRGRKSKKETAAEETQTGVDESVESVVSGVLLGEIQYIYLLELQRSRNAIVVLDQEATKFFVKDFNPRTKLLWDKRYVSMSRKCSSFKCILGESTTDNVVENVWMYCCSCDQPRSDFVMASGPYINMPHEEWLQLNPGCLHVQALGMAMKRFDDMFSISPSLEQDEDVQDPETEEDPSFLSMQSSVISVHPPSHSWGIISTSTQGMKCLTCKSSNLTCAHVKYVTTSLETDSCPDFVSDFNDACLEMANASKSSERGHKCLSYKQISFEKPGAVSRLLPIGDDVLSAIDEADVCPFCGDEPLSIHPAVKQLTLYTQYQREVVYVHNACAETCEHLIPFDGMEKGILNMGNFLLGHDVLRDYLTNFLCGRMPLFTFYSCWKQRQIDGGNLEDGMLSYSKFKFAWYSFLSLIGEDMTGDFICPICQDSPSIVIFDGTGLAFRRSYLPKLEANTTGEQIQGRRETGRFKDRVMIKHKKTRELLERYCNPQRPLESPAVLLSLLSDHSPPIKTVIDWCGDNNLAPKDLRAMLMSLAKPSPVCALLPAKEEVRLLLEQMKTADVKQEPALLQSLQLFCPVLFNVVKNLQLEERSLPEAFDALLSELWGKSIAPFEGSQQTNDVRPNAPTTTESNSFNECTSYWPHLPTVRSRGAYQQDQKSDRQSCRKLGKAHKILLPGTVTLHCQHAICYGFEIMLQVESPNTIFTILRTRFPIAPDVVIYDFACGLHNYCLNREANFFQHTKFLIDRYHQPNHKGCSLGYNMSLYPQFKTINSQIAEQKNSMLSRIKAQLSYMNPTNFSKHAQMFLWYHNKKKKASLLTS